MNSLANLFQTFRVAGRAFSHVASSRNSGCRLSATTLAHKKLIPPMVHVLISPGSGGEAEGTRMQRSVRHGFRQYGKYLLEEVLPDVEKTYRLRADAYSRAIGGAC